jgi:hypothetical protein
MNRADSLSAISPTTTEVFLSGQRVPPGIYRSLFSGAEILQSGDSCLPRQDDGARILYVRLTRAEGRASTSRTSKTNRIPKAFAPSEGKSGS